MRWPEQRSSRRTALVWLAGLVIVGLRLTRPFVVVVRGESMAPALADGDRLLGFRGVVRRAARPGDLVVIRADPNDHDQLVGRGERLSGYGTMVKRLQQRGPATVVFDYEPKFRNAVAFHGWTISDAKVRYRLGVGQISISADNAEAGTDSRLIGPVPEAAIRGVAFEPVLRFGGGGADAQ